jgi:predicted site-specific integrase-resolvase
MGSKIAGLHQKMRSAENNPTLNGVLLCKKVLMYSRVSTKDQELENQLRQLRQYASSQRWVVVETICDIASGGKDAKEREGLGRVLRLAHQRKFDVLLFWSLDRLSREGSRKTIGYLGHRKFLGVDVDLEISKNDPRICTIS